MIIAPIHEFNHCHNGGGAGGGQFCSKTRPSLGAHEAGLPGLYDTSIHRGEVPGPGDWATLRFDYGEVSVNLPRKTSQYASVVKILVGKAHRGKGYGVRLYRAVTDYVQQLGFQGIESSAGNRSADAERAWESLRKTGRVKTVQRPSIVGNTVSLDVLEFNHCHNPSGVGGGQFCSGGPWASSSSRVLTARRATVGTMRPATDKDRARLVIPPAYTNAMIAEDKNAEVQGTAVDAKGETHRYYKASYANRQQQAKWTRIVAFQKGLPALAAKIEKATLSPTKPGYNEAMTVRLILQTGLRNGGEAKGEHDSYGASSLRMEHVKVTGDTLTLAFPGKGGHAQDHTVTDRVLADYVRTRRAAGAETVFPHTSDDTYAYMQKVTGGKFKVHDIRTWYGTVYADRLTQAALADGLRPKTAKEFKAFSKTIATRVSEALGNTPAVALKNYIHPTVLKGLEP